LIRCINFGGGNPGEISGRVSSHTQGKTRTDAGGRNLLPGEEMVKGRGAYLALAKEQNESATFFQSGEREELLLEARPENRKKPPAGRDQLCPQKTIKALRFPGGEEWETGRVGH